MAMLTLRARHTGELTAVNLAAIATVTATVAISELGSHNTDSTEGDSPVFLIVSFIGTSLVTHFVTVNREGDEDKTITEPDQAVTNFYLAAHAAERNTRQW